MKRLFHASFLALALIGGLLLAGPFLRQVVSPTEPPIVLKLDVPGARAVPAALAPAPESGTESEPARSGPAEILFYERRLYQDHTDLVGLDLATGEEVLNVPNGQLTPDQDRMISTEVSGGKTTVNVLDLHGHELASQTLEGGYFIGRTSPDGRWLGLNPNFSASQLAGWQNGKQTSMQIAVVDTTAQEPPRYVRVPGYFLMDGLSNDGGRLYLIENLPDPITSRYWVRLYDMRTNTLIPDPVVEKGELDNPQPMSGVGLDFVFSPDGEWQHTLYVLGQEGHPFIHALSLSSAAALCLDLPGDHQQPELETAYSIALSPFGQRLYAVNTALQTVTAINMNDFTMRSGALEEPAAYMPARLAGWLLPVASAGSPGAYVNNAAVVSPDGRTLYAGGPGGVWVIDTSSLKTRKVIRPGTDGDVVSLALDPAGARLFGANYNLIQSFDLAAGRDSILVKDPGSIIRLLGVIIRE